MSNIALIVICSLLPWCCVKAAFEDFVVAPASKTRMDNNELAFGSEINADEEEQELIDMRDRVQVGIEDPQMLLRLLMQHAARLGVSVEQLVQMHSEDEIEPFGLENGCNAAESLSYGEQPSWYDVFFN